MNFNIELRMVNESFRACKALTNELDTLLNVVAGTEISDTAAPIILELSKAAEHIGQDMNSLMRRLSMKRVELERDQLTSSTEPEALPTISSKGMEREAALYWIKYNATNSVSEGSLNQLLKRMREMGSEDFKAVNRFIRELGSRPLEYASWCRHLDELKDEDALGCGASADGLDGESGAGSDEGSHEGCRSACAPKRVGAATFLKRVEASKRNTGIGKGGGHPVAKGSRLDLRQPEPYIFRSDAPKYSVTCMCREDCKRPVLIVDDKEICFSDEEEKFCVRTIDGVIRLVYDIPVDKIVLLAADMSEGMRSFCVAAMLCMAGSTTAQFLPSLVDPWPLLLPECFPELPNIDFKSCRPKVMPLKVDMDGYRFSVNLVGLEGLLTRVPLGKLFFGYDSVAFKDFGSGVTWVRKFPAAIQDHSKTIEISPSKMVSSDTLQWAGLDVAGYYRLMWELHAAYLLGCGGVMYDTDFVRKVECSGLYRQAFTGGFKITLKTTDALRRVLADFASELAGIE